MNKAPVHVAVGVINDEQGRILISKRPQHVHQGGLWEFPGGKVEAGEIIQHALVRELHEELGLSHPVCEPLISISHQYEDKHVLLDVWKVTHFQGLAHGREGQDVRWVDQCQLTQYTFPAANLPIIKALQLPRFYAILEGHDKTQVRQRLAILLHSGIQLLQVRLKMMAVPPDEAFFREIIQCCHDRNIRLMLNSAWMDKIQASVSGLHLTSQHLNQLETRPSRYTWVSASCHSEREIEKAERIGVDFVVLAPVKTTASHPDAQPLGWPLFANIVRNARLPVYALGGVEKLDLSHALKSGAQGIAGIRSFVAEPVGGNSIDANVSLR